jgi:hypothetical protein
MNVIALTRPALLSNSALALGMHRLRGHIFRDQSPLVDQRTSVRQWPLSAGASRPWPDKDRRVMPFAARTPGGFLQLFVGPTSAPVLPAT